MKMNLKSNKTKASITRIDVPLWAFSQLGKPVLTSQIIRENDQTYPIGSRFILDGISSQSNGSNHAVLTDENDRREICGEVPFSCLAQPIEPGILIPGFTGRLGEILFLWQHGFDLRKALSKATFYRYRSILLSHSIDICKPCPRGQNANI